MLECVELPFGDITPAQPSPPAAFRRTQLRPHGIVRIAAGFVQRLALSVIVIGAGAPLPAEGGTPTAPAKALYRSSHPSPHLVLANRKTALDWGETARRTIVPTMHLVETDHFLIFTAWHRENDGLLANLCERMYTLLSQQFRVARNESVWIGKCPIFIFWEEGHYDRFIAEVDGSLALDAAMAHANGYHATRGQLAYIVINGVSSFGATVEQQKAEFCHVLAHEGTHGFLDRYVSRASLPAWLEEGLAEYIAASLVPESRANRQYLSATLSGLRDPQSVRRLLDKKEHFTSTEYGIAHSLVRCLVQQDREAMVRLLHLLKNGEKEEDALAKAYRANREQFLQTWARTWQRAHR